MIEPWVWALIVSVVVALIGTLWAIVRKGNERTETTVSEHGERITALEAKVSHLESETKTLRERWHDLRGEVSRVLAEWYSDVIDRINRK